jgi:hypothetical protein
VIVQTDWGMTSVLVHTESGAGVVRTAHGLAVTIDVEQEAGGYLRAEDRYAPERAWGAAWERCAVGGLLPPGASSAAVIDELGQTHEAVTGEGAYVAEIGPASPMLAPVVCCYDEDKRVVPRPRAGEYPSVAVTDATERCPACGAIEWDEYVPTEQWRGGRTGAGGERVPSPIVCCRICGHEEPEGVFFAHRCGSDDGGDEAARVRRLADAKARARRRRWMSDTMTIRAAEFAIYFADGLPARVAGSGSQGEVESEITVRQYAALQSEDPLFEQTPALAITTALAELSNHRGLADLRRALEQWISDLHPGGDWPAASHAAITLWLRARQRERRARTLAATQDTCTLIVDGAPASAARLRTADGLWVAYVEHSDLILTVTGSDLAPTSLKLVALTDPTQLLGLEPPEL